MFIVVHGGLLISDEGYSKNLPCTTMNIFDEGYSRNPPCTTMNISDEGYSRSPPCKICS
jgi:hypothetical protein